MPMSAKVHRTSSTPHLGFNLAAITMIAALGALAVAYGIDAVGHHGGKAPAEGTRYVRNISGHTLTIPADWLRFGDKDEEGFASQVDLALHLPLGEGGKPVAVDVTLVPRSRARASADLLDGVYLHLFMPNEVVGAPGLVGKPLYPRDGFEGETVWYDPLSGDPFVAKCMDAADGGQAQCLRTVVLSSGIGAIYSFSAEALAAWRDFDTALAAPLKAIGAL